MNLIQLYLNNQKTPRNFRVENAGDEATIYLYDVIGGDWFGGISAKDFAAELTGITANTIHLRINSPGGDVFEGRAMATALQQHPAKIIAHVDALAASSASWIALAADEVEIADGAFFMIHNSWTLAMGDKKSMSDTAALLERLDETFVADYAKRTGKTENEIRAWMDAETWFGAQESIENGFADRIAESPKKTKNHWNLAAYKNAPKIQQSEELQVDRAGLERRLSFLEKIAA
ncbi:MAG: peptidase [Verrucomicrobiaceae bacterium]|nr:peptidase [Verrucomicrobiaceae bacterium]